jgi:hypothetical protein
MSRGVRCPPGVFCMTPMFLVGCGLIALLLVVIFWNSPIIYNQPAHPQRSYVKPRYSEAPVTIQIAAGQDDSIIPPKPERHWITRPDLPTASEMYGKLPRVPTRGIPETYQTMGIIKLDDSQILPLYGRRTTARSDRFQYYTRTDSYNPVQLPIRYNRRDCTDDIGCDELGNRDVVTIIPTNQRGTATIYRFDGPTYIPGII